MRKNMQRCLAGHKSGRLECMVSFPTDQNVARMCQHVLAQNAKYSTEVVNVIRFENILVKNQMTEQM